MQSLKRGDFLRFGMLAMLAGIYSPEAFGRVGNPERRKSRGVTPVIHTTDLYHIHNDPDDHFDLATVYALAFSGDIYLPGILLDFPSQPELGDPDVMGVAQMNYLTGLVIPAVVGTPLLMTTRDDTQPEAGRREHQGIDWLLETMRSSGMPVVIQITGSATNVAVALKKAPALFREKCKAIYLYAGSADSVKDKKLEYNVKLNPPAFAAIFDAPCPVYWLPCTTRTNIGEVGEYGSYFRFTQKEILPALPEKLQNFFLFMLGQKKNHAWFSYLNNACEQNLLEASGNTIRHMWCTAGIIHAAGKTVTSGGDIVPLNAAIQPVFSFDPVKVSCDDKGYADWEPDKHSRNRFIFHVNDVAGYQQAMTLALKKILLQFWKL